MECITESLGVISASLLSTEVLAKLKLAALEAAANLEGVPNVRLCGRDWWCGCAADWNRGWWCNAFDSIGVLKISIEGRRGSPPKGVLGTCSC